MWIQYPFAFPARPVSGKWILKHLAGGLLGLSILTLAAVHSGPTHGEVVVHVTEPDVDVSLGGRTFHIEERRFDPIVCQLLPGWHELVLKRRGLVLDHQSFKVQRGQSLVLTAGDPNRDRSKQHIRRLGEDFLMPRGGTPRWAESD
jgi:hypothetical protein